MSNQVTVDRNTDAATMASMFPNGVIAVRLKLSQRVERTAPDVELYSSQGMSITFGIKSGQFVSTSV